MPALLRFNGAVDHEPGIANWFDQQSPELASIARTWFAVMRQYGPGILELMHDGSPTVVIEDAGLAYVNAFTHHVNVGFFQGASLPDPAGLLQGSGKFMRHVKLRPGVAVDEAALKALIAAAYQDIVEKLKTYS